MHSLTKLKETHVSLKFIPETDLDEYDRLNGDYSKELRDRQVEEHLLQTSLKGHVFGNHPISDEFMTLPQEWDLEDDVIQQHQAFFNDQFSGESEGDDVYYMRFNHSDDGKCRIEIIIRKGFLTSPSSLSSANHELVRKALELLYEQGLVNQGLVRYYMAVAH